MNGADLEEVAVTVTDLKKSYGRKEVLRGITFSVPKGEIFGLLGPNGAGKTTLWECVAGIRQPSAGRIEVLGMDPRRDRTRFTERVAIQPQTTKLFEYLTVDETLEMFRSFYVSGAQPDEMRTLVGLDGERRTRVRVLSGGQARRLALAVALIGNPEVVLLDEPTAGIDAEYRQRTMDLIRARSGAGVTVLLTTHLLEEAELLCDRVGVLVGGRLVDVGTPQDLVAARDAGTTVSFSTDTRAQLARIPDPELLGTVTVRESRGGIRVSIVTSTPDDVVRRLTFTPGLRARNIRIHAGTLEDYFLAVSGGEHPDD